MKVTSDPHAGPLLRRNEPDQGEPELYQAPARDQTFRGSAPPRVDAWVFIDLFASRWHWLLLNAVLFGGLFFLLGTYVIKPKFTATAQLLRYETPTSDFFRTPPMTAETFSGVIRSPDLLRRTADQALAQHGMAPIPPERLVKMIKIEPEPDSDMVKLSLAGTDPQKTVDLLNVYAREAVEFTRELQRQQATAVVNNYLKQLVTRMDEEIRVLHERFRNMPLNPELTNKLAEIGGNLGILSTNLAASPRNAMLVAEETRRLQTALGELNDLLLRFTDLHPSVQAKRHQIKEIEARISQAATNPNPILAGISSVASPFSSPRAEVFNPELDIVRTKLLSLEQGRVELANRQHEAQLFANEPPGVARVFAPANLKTVASNMRWIKVGFVSTVGMFGGVLAGMLLVMLVELTDKRLKTADDLARVARLPVLTTLGNLQDMSPEERSAWAFRTWTLLQGRLSPTANHGLVCGITSATRGEGRSTWIRLLADAASQTGFRVLTIATKPSPNQNPDEAARKRENASSDRGGSHPVAQTRNSASNALTQNVLSSPMQVTEKLTGENSQPAVHIPLPGWVWNLERRKQWGEALSHWRKIENLVILVELPPASVPEAVLLGSNLPNMIWLSESGKADALKTRSHLQTLRDARCHLVGAVLNREPGPSLKTRFPRWLGCIVLATVLGSSFSPGQPLTNSAAPAVVAVPAPEEAPLPTGSFSVISPEQRAEWQKRLTLGPGDVLNLGLFGQPELTRQEVAIGPDGRLSYLEAQDVPAAGTTIDELRARLDEELGKYRRAARSIITPVAFRSKKYFILGKVMTRGVYLLDRPMTVLEAIARAKGLENGLVDRNIIDLADFQHAFLARGGKRYPLNFEKLFQQGDLSQNIPIEPGDYIYFPSSDIREVYVVGEVRLPGPVVYTPQLNIIGAIAARGGYTERAYKMRVLVVRGSINKPEPIVVDTHAILDARTNNFRLRPNDIVYVNSRPLIRVEELADAAATAFIQSLIATWVGVDVVSPVD